MKNLLNTAKMQDIENYTIRYKATKHWISYVIPTLYTAIGSIGIIPTFFGSGSVRIVGIILLILFFKGLTALFKRISTKIYLSDSHLTISKNFLGSNITDIPLNKLEGISLTQNFIGKLLNYGSLTVTTGDLTQSYLIKNPQELRNKILNT